MIFVRTSPAFDACANCDQTKKFFALFMVISDRPVLCCNRNNFHCSIDMPDWDVFDLQIPQKTIAYLLPSIQRILLAQNKNNDDSNNEPDVDVGKTTQGVQMVVLAPTRELAQQIHDSTVQLTRYTSSAYNSDGSTISCQVCYGGGTVSRNQDMKEMERNGPPTILIATPGRFLDHLLSSTVHGIPFRSLVQDTMVLVLDEMDRLLDLGFRDVIKSILDRHLTRSDRQTLLFSATTAQQVKLEHYVRPDYALVDCVKQSSGDGGVDDDGSDHDPNAFDTSMIEQSYAVLPPNKQVLGVVKTIQYLMKSHRKILVFFPTISQVSYFSHLLNSGLGVRVLELHSRQDNRNIVSERFRHASKAVMLTSDVSARGVDYPDVGVVLQVGAASNRETYIHRLGRTGRAGKSGRGVLLCLLPAEQEQLQSRDLYGMDIPIDAALQNFLELTRHSAMESDMNVIQKGVRDGLRTALENDAIDAYNAMFNYYAQRLKMLSVKKYSEALVELVNGFAAQSGLSELPLIPSKLAQQYGLERHPNLNVSREWKTGARLFDVGQRKEWEVPQLNELATRRAKIDIGKAQK
jgi:ATP-dependent RNA helicase MSS116, mitochondrial